MLSVPASLKIFVATQPVDMRRGHDGLRATVEQILQQDPYGGHLFVFFGKRLDRVKVLFWDNGGFALYYKRLEKGRFKAVSVSSESHTMLSNSQLSSLLYGLDWTRVGRANGWHPKKKRSTQAA